MNYNSRNLFLMRFIAALFVMFSHSFSITQGSIHKEWLYRVTGGQLDFGLVAVCLFFWASGFFVTKSILHRNGQGFFKSRIIRIIPPLAFMTVLVFILGTFFSELSPKEYFGTYRSWMYLLNSFMILIHNLPGVFLHNPYLPTVNGALWTLPLEAVSYVGCFLFFRLSLFEKKSFAWTIPAAAVGVTALLKISEYVPIVGTMIMPFLFFYFGMAFWVYKDYIPVKRILAAAALILLILFCRFGIGKAGLALFFPYLIYVLSFSPRQISEKKAKSGEYSYALYLWGFPVQQAVTALSHGLMSPYRNFLLSVPVAVAFSMITYHLVEKPLQRS